MASLARTAVAASKAVSARTSAAASVSAAASAAPKFRTREIHGVVIKSGFMDKTVTVTVADKKWNSLFKKYYTRPLQHLVHDPRNSLRTGDVVAIVAGWRVSKTVRHVVNRIIKPAGVPMEERPRVPSEKERVRAREAAKAAKDERRALGRRMQALAARAERAVELAREVAREARKAVAPGVRALEEKRAKQEARRKRVAAETARDLARVAAIREERARGAAARAEAAAKAEAEEGEGEGERRG
ncbi:hypothetical protein QBC39DRAFT_421917 [Podospora conica]|nr:hypothetical protein QBC39DRAFT_421917 [Schizothecium conicum]